MHHTDGKSRVEGSSIGDTKRCGDTAMLDAAVLFADATIDNVESAAYVDAEAVDAGGSAIDASTAAAAMAVVGIDTADCDCPDTLLGTAVRFDGADCDDVEVEE